MIRLRRDIPGLAAAAAFALIIQPGSPALAQTPPAVPASSAPTKNAAAVVRRTLPSGLHLIVVEDPGSDLTAIDLQVPVGSAGETAENNGVAHFIEHVLCKGTATEPRGGIDAKLEALGGELDARTSRDWTRYAVTVPSGEANWRGALGVMSDMLLHPAFRPEDVAAERSVIRGEMASALSEPPRLGSSELYAAVFAKQSDGTRFPIMGSVANLDKLQADDLRAFWSRWYRPENLTLVVVGKVTAEAVATEASRLFPGAPSAPSPANATNATSAEPTLDGVLRAPAPPLQSERDLVTVLIGFYAPGLSTPDDVPAADVLASLMAEGGMRGRLGEALIRQSHLALSVSADYLPGKTSGLFLLSAVCPVSDAHPLEGAMLREVEKLRGEDPILDSDILEARGWASNDVRYADATVTGRALRLGMLNALGAPPALADDYTSRIQAVTPEQVRKVAARYLTSGRCAIVWIGPAGAALPERHTEGTP